VALDMGLTKHGTGEIIREEEDLSKEASVPFSESDRVALAKENAEADAEEEDID